MKKQLRSLSKTLRKGHERKKSMVYSIAMSDAFTDIRFVQHGALFNEH